MLAFFEGQDWSIWYRAGRRIAAFLLWNRTLFDRW